MIHTRAGEIRSRVEEVARSIVLTSRNEIEQAGARFALERINAAHLESTATLQENDLDLKITDAFLEEFAITRVQLTSYKTALLQWPQQDEASVKIVLLLKGKIVLSVANNLVTLQPDHLNMIYQRTDALSLMHETGATDFVVLTLSENFIKTLIPQTEHDVFDKDTQLKIFFESGYKKSAVMSDLINHILDYKCPKYLKRIHLQSKITELFFQLLLVYSEKQATVTQMPVHIEKQMYEARQQIIENIRNPYTLKTLARTIGTNEYELKRNFKQTFGMTVFGYINEVRMQRAQKYLKSSHLSIAQIADKIGYKNPQHFSTAFKKSTGVTPSAYRDKLN